MALPKLNDAPKYEIVVPSTGQKVRYRPYLVKEEKILMLAMESQDQRSALSAIVDTIGSCVQDDLDTKNLTTFDVEYLFTQIRSKSVGETAKNMSTTDQTFKMIAACIDSVQTDEENIRLRDEPEADQMAFIESLSSAQFDKIRAYVEKMPKMEHHVSFECSSCKKGNDITLSGISDFF